MTFNSLPSAMFVVAATLAAGIAVPNAARASSIPHVADAVRQSIIQNVRDDVQRRTERQDATRPGRSGMPKPRLHAPRS